MARRGGRTGVWDPADYAGHSGLQLAWARDLIAQLNLTGTEHILDVGCGDGKVTAELARAVPHGGVVGIDRAAEMIRFARAAFPPTRHPNLQFRQMDARHIAFEQRFDVVFSNAALHWVDDHEAVLRGVAACLRPGGRLIVSCAGHGNAQAVFDAVRSQMRLARWRPFFRQLTRPYFFYAPAQYEQWLGRYGFALRRVALAEKEGHFAGREGLAAWLRTTWLPYVQRVPGTLREGFIAGVVDRYVTKHPPDASGRVSVRMVRLEIDAVKV